MTEAVKAPAIGYSVTCNLDGNRQIVFQCFVDQDEDDASVNAKLDRVLRFSDRQRARYELVDMAKEIDELTKTLDQFDIEKGRVEENFQKAQASFDLQIMELRAQAKDLQTKGYNEHAASGRKGDYVPRGATAAQLANIEVAIADADRQKTEQVEARAAALANTATNMDNRKRRIAELKAKMDEARKLVEG
jgi:hypothetical protein